MKKISSTLFMALFLLLAGALTAQERYLEQVFDEVQLDTGVTYGVNATVLFAPQVGEAIPEELKMDVYQPEGDTETERPLVLILHTGNFLPIVQNAGLQGQRTDSSVVEISNRLTKMGYVVASLDYRYGWNPLAEAQDDRTLTLLQAAYRGVQDVRTCIRYFRRDVAESGNTYGVDTSRIVVWGVGTGGYISLAAATLDDYNKIPASDNPLGKFLVENPIAPGQFIPMVIPGINGDINGLGYGILPFDTGGLAEGDTLNYPNHEGYSSDFDLSVNMGGALGDLSWLNAGQVPTITFQTPTDPFAPYVDDVLIVPTTNDPVVQVQGGRLVAEKANVVGNNDVFKAVENLFPNDPYTAQAKASSAIAGHDYYEGLYPLIRPTNSLGNEEGDPWTWWDPEAPAPGIGLPWDQLEHPTGGTFHTNALENNEDMSPEKAKMYIDTIMGYFAPRAFLALNLAYDATARVQVIHNAPSPTVDVYINGELAIDDFEFRTATPYLDLPAETEVAVAIAPGNSTSVEDALATFDYTLADGGSYVIMATGVLGDMDTPFDLKVFDMGQEAAAGGSGVDVLLYHGSPDAPAVDVWAGEQMVVYDNIAYGEFQGYANLPAGPLVINISPNDDLSTIVKSYGGDLTLFNGGAAVAFASGFLSPGEDEPDFGLFVALPIGLVVGLQEIIVSTNELDDKLGQFQVLPNPVRDNVQVRYALNDRANMNIRLFDLTGRLLLNQTLGEQPAGDYTYDLDVSNLPAGNYNLSLISDKGVATRQIIIKR